MENKNQAKLLSEFPTPSYDQWLQLVEQQLKGASFEAKLVGKTFEGIPIKPLYQKADVIPTNQSVPGYFPFQRSTRLSGLLENGWQISQQYNYPDATSFNQAVLHDLKKGLQTVSFGLDYTNGWGLDPDQVDSEPTGLRGLSLFCREDLRKAFEGLEFDGISLLCRPRLSFLPFLGMLVDYLKEKGMKPEILKGGLVVDPLVELAIHGGLPQHLKTLFSEMAVCLKWAEANTPELKVLGIDLCPYTEAGASAVQELAYAVATGVEYLRELQQRGVTIESAARQANFFFAVGSDFFMNQAKFRAARQLWAKAVSLSGGSIQAQKMVLHATTARYNKTIFDPHVNLLRATTEAYSAVLAGCDSVSVAPFDEVYHLPEEFSGRISRNIQIILKEECHGNRPIDPGGGAWYLEELTSQLAAKAWQLFQEIEKVGGMSKAITQGIIQEQVAEIDQQKRSELATRKQVLVGTNQYANLEDKQPSPIDLGEFWQVRKVEASNHKAAQSFEDEALALANDSSLSGNEVMEILMQLIGQGATLGQLTHALGHHSEPVTTATALKIKRLAAEYEELRQRAASYKEREGSWPEILLVNMGPVNQHKARADFSTTFLQPGGFAVINSDGYLTIDEAITATLNSRAKIAVVCSTDDTYPDLIPAYADQVKRNRPEMMLVLAGYPKAHLEAFKQAGIDQFIHLKANNLELLRIFQEHSGVTA